MVEGEPGFPFPCFGGNIIFFFTLTASFSDAVLDVVCLIEFEQIIFELKYPADHKSYFYVLIFLDMFYCVFLSFLLSV